MKVKFSFLVFSLGFPFPDVTAPFRFDDSTELIPTSIKDQIDNQDSKHWAEWVGSIQWERLCGHRLVLSTWKQSQNPEALDGDNNDLNTKLLEIFRVLPLVAPLTPPFEESYLISGQGELQNGVLKAKQVRSFSRVNAWTRSYYNEHHWMEYSNWASTAVRQQNILDAWKECHDHFHRLLIKGQSNRQILECFRSYEEAMKSSQLEFKMPNLVRAMECIIDCWSFQQFAARVLQLTGTPPSSLPFGISSNAKTLLEELYQLRNDCSHGKPFAYSIQKKTGAAPSGELVATYEFLTEWAARKILNDSFINPTILNASTDRDTLVAAWKNNLIQPL